MSNNDSDIILLKYQMQKMEDEFSSLKTKFDTLNQDYQKLVNRGFGMVLLVSTLGVTSGYLLNWFKQMSGGSQ